MKKPILLSYSTLKRRPIFIERSEDRVTAAEMPRTGIPSGILYLVGCAVAVFLLLGFQLRRNPQELSGIAALAAACMAGAVVAFVWSLIGRSAKTFAYLEISRSTVVIRKRPAFGDISFPTEELAGVICSRVERDKFDLELRHGAPCLKLLRTDGSSENLFAGHTEQLLEEVEFECRMFLSSIRPSPMADAVTPPRPKR